MSKGVVHKSRTDFDEFKNKLEEEKKEFKLKIEEKKKELGVTTDEELVEKLPVKKQEDGVMDMVTYNGIALTDKGELTRHRFFQMLESDKEIYGDLMLTADQAHKLHTTMNRLATGVNSVIPILCTGERCPFKDECFYYQNNIAPINKPCLVEYDLLIYHTKRFIDEFDVHPDNHSELNLVQELAELIILEMRATRVLAKNPELYYEKITYDKQGNEVVEQVPHWAFGLKESIKNRRMKLLDALMATRKNISVKSEANEDMDDIELVKYMKEKIRQAGKDKKIENANYEIISDDKKPNT